MVSLHLFCSMVRDTWSGALEAAVGLAGGSWRVAVAYGKTAPGDSHSLTDDGNPYESCPCLCHHDHAPALFCVSSCVSMTAP